MWRRWGEFLCNCDETLNIIYRCDYLVSAERKGIERFVCDYEFKACYVRCN